MPFTNIFSRYCKSAIRIAPVVIFFIAVCLVSTPYVANAQFNPISLAATYGTGAVLDIVSDLPAALVNGINLLINLIIGFILGILTWAIGIILSINNNVIDSPVVQFGFQTSLSVVNLGFVVAIIVIAIMTIFRKQSFAIKETLWRLIAAAILVNFSIVITSVLINFSGSLTNYLMSSLPNNTKVSTMEFAQRLTFAFSPQKYLNPQDACAHDNTSAACANLTSSQRTVQLAGAGGSWVGKILAPVSSLVFSTINLILIAITLATFLVMLVARYVVLGFLILIMPFVWLLWIFPDTRKYWSQWWDWFMRWTFFAPIVVFFLWIVIQTGELMNRAQSGNAAAVSAVESFGIPAFNGALPALSSGDGFLGAISAFAGNLFAPLLTTAMNNVILLGITMGGLYAANKLSIFGADTGFKAAKTVTDGFGGYVGRRAKQASTSLLRMPLAQKGVKNLQQAGAGMGMLGRLGTLPVRYAGRGAQALATQGGEKAVEEAKKNSGDMTLNQKIEALSTATAPQRIAWLKEIHEAGKIKDVAHIERYIGKDKEKEFDRYGKKGFYEDVRKETLFEFVEKTKSGEMTPEKLKDYFAGVKDLGAAADFFSGKGVFGMKGGSDELNKMRVNIAKGIAQGASPSAASAFFNKLAKGEQLKSFKEAASGEVKREDINDRLWNWLDNNAGKSLGLDASIFGLEPTKPEKTDEPKVILTDKLL